MIKWLFVLSFILCHINSLLSKLWTWKLWDFFLLLKKSYIRQQTQSQLFRKRHLASSATSPVYLLSRCCCHHLQSFIFTSLQFSFGSCRLHFVPSFPLYTLWGNYCVARAFKLLFWACPFSTHWDVNIRLTDNQSEAWKDGVDATMGAFFLDCGDVTIERMGCNSEAATQYPSQILDWVCWKMLKHRETHWMQV